MWFPSHLGILGVSLGKLTFRSLAASIVALLCAGIGIAASFCVRKLKPMVTVQVAASQPPRIWVDDSTGFINGKCNGLGFRQTRQVDREPGSKVQQTRQCSRGCFEFVRQLEDKLAISLSRAIWHFLRETCPAS